jgi:small-conductance mechanosensitive channel
MTLLAALAITLLVAVVVPTASAEPLNVFDVDDYSRSVAAGGDAEFSWVVFNNGTSPLLVKPRLLGDLGSDVTAAFEPSFITLTPGSSSSIILRVDTDPNMGDADLAISVGFDSTPMDDPSQVDAVVRTATVQVDSNLGKVGNNALFGIWPNNLPSPLDGNWGAFLVTIIGWVLIALFFAFVIDPLVHYLTRRTDTTLDDTILRIMRAPVFIFILSYGAVSSLEILDIDRDLVAQIEAFYRIVVVLLIVWVVYKVYDEIILHYARGFAQKTATEVDDVIVPLLEKIGLIIIPLVGLMTVLSMLGYDLTALLAGVGFLGIVVGFAAQSTLANFFAGLQLILDRPFKVGDLLRLEDGSNCEVKAIGLRATELYNPDTQEKVVVPNDQIANKQLINMAAPDRMLTLGVAVGVAYGSDTEKVMETLYDAAASHPNVLVTATKKPVVRFSDFDDSCLTFKTFIPIDDLKNRFKVASDFRAEVNRRFAKEGIEIPFPQSVVTIKYDKPQEKA